MLNWAGFRGKNFNQMCRFLRNRQDGLRQSVRISIKSADFRTKRSKTFKSAFAKASARQERSKTFKKLVEIFKF
jgi:hypothetical protein